MALFMTSNNLTPEDVYEKGHSLSFPESVKQLLKGELGQPYLGFPEKLQKIVLKGEEPITGRPNDNMKPVDFDKDFAEFQLKFQDAGFLDFISWSFYPKVFEEYYENKQKYDEVYLLPTPAFFYGLKSNEELIIEIDQGKTLLVKFLYVTDSSDKGFCTAYFELNGQTRRIFVRNNAVEVTGKQNEKASEANHIGAPLQGKISNIFVKEGQEVKSNTPLFVIEAMKMESVITAHTSGKIARIALGENSLVSQDDLVIVLE
jgi:pyruvate carboxylase